MVSWHNLEEEQLYIQVMLVATAFLEHVTEEGERTHFQVAATHLLVLMKQAEKASDAGKAPNGANTSHQCDSVLEIKHQKKQRGFGGLKEIPIENHSMGHLHQFIRSGYYHGHHRPLQGFSRERYYPEGLVDLEPRARTHQLSRTIMLEFHVVKSASIYNVMFGRTKMQKINMEIFTTTPVIEFPTKEGMATVRSDYLTKDATLEGNRTREILWKAIPTDNPMK
ncbi:hypothetical protein Tco_0690478 [Tanacetum coccineum]